MTRGSILVKWFVRCSLGLLGSFKRAHFYKHPLASNAGEPCMPNITNRLQSTSPHLQRSTTTVLVLNLDLAFYSHHVCY